jgi:2-methylisocitrate lyase-like PEP mutase family enzyme
LIWVQSRGNRDGRPILPLGDLQAMGYRGCIDAQVLLGTAFHFMKRALAELIATGNLSQVSDTDFVTLRKEIEDLIGLDAYYRIEAETVEPDSRPG